MIRSLLIRGMLAGALAGVLAFAFAYTLGEPAIDQAIALEETASAQAPAETAEHTHDDADAAHRHGEDAAVSRTTQAGIQLFTGVVAYGAAFGGVLALVFAFAYGRVGQVSPRTLAALLAAIGFIAIIIVPQLKYPANPPAVGSGDTIGFRTATFMVMLTISLAAAAVAGFVRHRLIARLGGWNATLAAGGVFIAAIAVAMLVLPSINEVPDGYPPALLWQFRIAAIGTQAVLWTALGLLFGVFAERRLVRAA